MYKRQVHLIAIGSSGNQRQDPTLRQIRVQTALFVHLKSSMEDNVYVRETVAFLFANAKLQFLIENVDLS